MSLDQNLFTLHLAPNKDNPNIVDLVDPSGTIHYRKHRLPGVEYKIEVYDPLSQSLLITATSPNVTSKTKKLELYNPTILVELKYTGTLSFRWNFKFEEHEFEWKREECYMLRKPDPPVLIAITKEPAGRLRTATVQILDYNLNRFDIDDRKGLEIVILTALLTFSDVNEGYHAPSETARRSVERTPPAPNAAAVSRQTQPPAEEAPPLPPPKPAPKTGVDRIAEMQAALGEYNEIFVEEEGQVRHYAEYCSRLLEDDAMLFVTIRSAAAEQVPKVLQVVQETKRIRHKAGLSEEAELHQYVVYDEVKKKKGPRRINLDDVKPPNTTTYTPPTSLAVHLSKIDMPELQPKATVDERPSGSTNRDIFKDTSSQDSSPSRESKAKKSKKDDKKASRPNTPPANSSKLIKHGRSSSPAARGHAQYLQSSSSPPRVNTPSSYAGPLGEEAPSYDYKRPDLNSPVSFPTPAVPVNGALNTGWEPPNNAHHPPPGYRSGSYAPPHHPSAPGTPYPPSNSGYDPSYTSAPPSYLPPPPPPHHPSISHGHSSPSSPSSPHKPSVASSLLDSFWRR